MKVLTRGKRQKAIQAHQQGFLTISWGSLEDPERLLRVAGREGWPMPASGLTSWLMDIGRHMTWRSPDARFKEAFLAKMFENDENFNLAVAIIGIDVYVPDSWRE